METLNARKGPSAGSTTALLPLPKNGHKLYPKIKDTLYPFCFFVCHKICEKV